MIRRIRALIQGSLRPKLLALALFPSLLVMPVLILLVYLWGNEVSYRQLLMKVNTDLAVAEQALHNTQQDYLFRLGRMAESYPFRSHLNALALDAPAGDALAALLDRLRQQGFDYLRLYGPGGCQLLHRSRCDLRAGPLVDQAASGQPAVGMEVYAAAALEQMDPSLAQAAYLPLQATQRARPTPRLAEDRGLLIRALYPVIGDQGQVEALLEGGVLLNGNFDFVDTLRDLVYSPGSLPEGSLGTVTVFLDDVRISTNVPRELEQPRERALGTRVSQEVRQRVLDQGQTWVDRAFVVSDWYISAYQPLLDTQGQRVGMLYAGFLEAPFRATYIQALKLLLLIFLGVVLAAVIAAVVGARSIFRPIEAMASVIRLVGQGVETRIGPIRSQDEIGELAQRFDDLLDRLAAQRRVIEEAAENLERKVAQRTEELSARTAELERHIALLNRTREQLVAREKLAAVGQLAAGIAHEINNPTAVILGNLDLLVAELGEAVEPAKPEVELIIQQVYRIRELINNLLRYSRPDAEQEGLALQAVDINRVVRDALVLLRHDIARQGAAVRQDLRARAPVAGHHQPLQQVLINLLANSLKALGGSGKISIRTRDCSRGGVLLQVRDSGDGIAEQDLPRIFDPFFTRAPGGTGLGLSICYGILKRYGAEVRVRSWPGKGTSFLIWLAPSSGMAPLSISD